LALQLGLMSTRRGGDGADFAPTVAVFLAMRVRMTYLVSATIDDLARIEGVRYDEKQALTLALSYQRQGYKDIRVKADDGAYSLAQFRFLVE